jgi:hypothetical protein
MCVSPLEAGLLCARASPFVVFTGNCRDDCPWHFSDSRRLGKHTIDLDSRNLPLDFAEGQGVVSKPK